MNNFLWLAWLAGIGIAIISAPLGCFVVWRRMAYFGDTMSHSALLGVAIGFLLKIDLTLGVLLVCLIVALILIALQSIPWFSYDMILGILSHSALSIGLVVLSFIASVRLDLMSYLFGDILAISVQDLAWIYGGGTLILAILWRIRKGLLALTIHEDLACVEGVSTASVKLIFMLLIALVVAIAMKIIGVLLVTSLLIIPPATARQLAKTPEQMIVWSALWGSIAVSGGLGASLFWDTPSGPSIVVVAALLFVLSLLVGYQRANV